MSRPVELSTPMTPDSLRQTAHLLKHLYAGHTPVNKNDSEVDGTEHIGTVANFGSEILTEASQLRLKYPNPSTLHVSDAMNFYFDLKPSELINTIGQQNILCAVLKPIDFLVATSEKTIRYDIIFRNCVEEYALRPKSKSYSDIERSRFFSTTTVPVIRTTKKVLVPDVGWVDQADEYDLCVYDDTGVDTKYMFMVSKATEDMLPDGYTMDEIIINIQPDTIDDNVYGTVENIHRLVGTPYIWMILESFKTLPDIGWVNGMDASNRPLFLDSVSSLGERFLYPMCQPGVNMPQDVYDYYYSHDTRGRYILIRASGDFSSINNADPYNYDTYVTRIDFIIIELFAVGHDPTPEDYWASIVYSSQPITFDPTNTKIKLMDLIWHQGHQARIWNFGKDGAQYVDAYGEETDYTWTLSGENLEQGIFAYSMYEFQGYDDVIYNLIYGVNNLSTHSTARRPAFRLILDDQHHIHPMEQAMNHTTTGMHVDSGTDYSDNAIPKKRGLIHDFSAFDGIPRYMSEWTPKDIKRGHLELYTVRDNIIKNDPMTRQIAGIIIDSGVPQNSINDVLDDLNVVIKYTTDGVFVTEGVSTSSSNQLSDIGYAGNGVMGYSTGPNPAFPTLDDYKNSKKIIYHGNGEFSLGRVGFDGELETGRVIILSNDPATYVNHSLDGKPLRTFARMCDIPTSYLELTHIEGKSPTFVLNQEYVRQGAPFTLDDQEKVWNGYHSQIIHDGSKYILNYNEPFFTDEFLAANYSETVQDANGLIDLTDPENATGYAFTISNAGTFEDGDTFMIVIGGVTFTGTFNNDGTPSVSIDSNDEHIIPIANIPGQTSLWKTTATNSTHSGLVVQLQITDNDLWNNLNPHAGNVYDDLYALKRDQFGNIFAYHYTSPATWTKEFQVYGDDNADNMYDKSDPTEWATRDINSCIITNWNTGIGGVHTTDFEPFEYIDRVDLSNTGLVYSDDDMSADIQNVLLNYSQSYYVLDTSNVLHVVTTVHPNRYLELPQNHGLNTKVADQNVSSLYMTTDATGIHVSYFDPLLTSIPTYSRISSDILDYAGTETAITREGYFGSFSNLKMYDYSYINDIEDSNERRDTYAGMTDTALLELIQERYGVTFDVYEHETLVDYLMERDVQNPIYKHSDLKLMENNENPTGGYVNVYDDVYDARVRIGGSITRVEPSFVFRFNETISQINTAVGGNWREKVKMFDEDGRDISDYSILIIENKLFTYSNGTWVEAQRPNT